MNYLSDDRELMVISTNESERIIESYPSSFTISQIYERLKCKEFAWKGNKELFHVRLKEVYFDIINGNASNVKQISYEHGDSPLNRREVPHLQDIASRIDEENMEIIGQTYSRYDITARELDEIEIKYTEEIGCVLDTYVSEALNALQLPFRGSAFSYNTDVYFRTNMQIGQRILFREFREGEEDWDE